MPHILTTSELEAVCNNLLITSERYSLQIAPFIESLYDTGLRINEVYELNRWSILEDGSYRCVLEKDSGFRLFTSETLPAIFRAKIAVYPTSPWLFRTRQLNYFIRPNTGWARLSVGNKEIASHLFRYNYCRQLYAAGWTLSQIQTQIVHSSLSVTSGYVFNDIIGSDIR